MHHQGTVILLVLVGVNGEALEVKVQQSSGYHELDRAAVQAAQHWRFNPGTHAGQPQKGWARVPVTFNLNQTY